MTSKLFRLTLLFVMADLVMAPAPKRNELKTTSQVCRLVSDEGKNFDRFRFVSKATTFKRRNRFPRVAYVVTEDGSVSDVEVLRGTASQKVDVDLAKSIQAWKYQPQQAARLRWQWLS